VGEKRRGYADGLMGTSPENSNMHPYFKVEENTGRKRV
jgi:hypothetical protein